jgi:signal transduction histidine kinase
MYLLLKAWLLHYGLAALVIGLLVVLKTQFGPLRAEENPFPLFLAGVMFSAWLGGFGPGLVATAAAALLSDLFFFTPGRVLHENSFEENLQVGLFLSEGTAISWGTSALRKSLLELKQADRHKDDFLATLAHELRNHLAPIHYGLAAVQAAVSDPATVERVRCVMERQLRQLTRLVDDLLDLSRIRSGKIHLRRERVDVADVIRDAVQASRPLIEQLRHELTVTLPEQPLYVNGDAARLVQALANLLNNAAKYTHEGGRINLSVERVDNNVQIHVQDTGVGIPADLLPTIFNRFVQVSNMRDRAQGGLGIGLSLVRHITELHDGTVVAISDGPGQGSDFCIRLPRADDRDHSLMEAIPRRSHTKSPIA